MVRGSASKVEARLDERGQRTRAFTARTLLTEHGGVCFIDVRDEDRWRENE